jgi:hypothetical protein
MVGYSHGGGLIYELTTMMWADPELGQNSIFLTTYIDGIAHDQMSAEIHRPVNTLYHMNFYQSQGIDLHGALTVNGDTPNVDLDATGAVGHLEIDDADTQYWDASLPTPAWKNIHTKIVDEIVARKQVI